MIMKRQCMQTRTEWLKWRKIGSSDAPIIMGVSPWTTPYQLWMQKVTGQERADNEAMKRGRDMEEPTRKLLEKRTGMLFIPINVESKQWEFMTASLDGYDEDNRIITEIKNCNEKDHLMAKSGKVPEKYFPQLQHQLVCEERAEKVLYSSFFVKNKNKPIHLLTEDDIDMATVDVFHDDKYIKKLIPAEAEFADMLLSQTPPNKSLKDEPYHEPDQDMIQRFEALKEIAKQKDEWESREKEARKEIIEMSSGKHIKFPDGSKLYSSFTKGSVQYDQIPELNGVNLDQYRKEPYLKWTLRFK